MGFGILFIGFFLLLNIPYHSYTDAISAVISLYALYKLSGVNLNFKRASYVAIGFSVFGFLEFLYSAIIVFVPTLDIPEVFTVVSVVRYAVVCLLSVMTFLGMRDVANEVGLRVIAIKCERVIYMSYPIYALSVISELLSFFDLPFTVMQYIAVVILVCNMALIIISLMVIYNCYMRICMPEDEDMPERESKFGFVNAFRRHEDEKRREYAEYKLEKMKKKQQKQKEKDEKGQRK